MQKSVSELNERFQVLVMYQSLRAMRETVSESAGGSSKFAFRVRKRANEKVRTGAQEQGKM